MIFEGMGSTEERRDYFGQVREGERGRGREESDMAAKLCLEKISSWTFLLSSIWHPSAVVVAAATAAVVVVVVAAVDGAVAVFDAAAVVVVVDAASAGQSLTFKLVWRNSFESTILPKNWFSDADKNDLKKDRV